MKRDIIGRFKKHNIPWNKDVKNPYGCKENGPNWKGGNIKLVCHSCKKSFYRPKSKSNRKYCSQKCYGKSKIGKPPWNKGIPRPEIRGKNHPMWKGGRTISPSKRLRHTIEWKEWREKVYKRDNYTCQICYQRGGKLEPHHIFPKSKFKKLTFIIGNGITLCKRCHTKLHKKVIL